MCRKARQEIVKTLSRSDPHVAEGVAAAAHDGRAGERLISPPVMLEDAATVQENFSARSNCVGSEMRSRFDAIGKFAGQHGTGSWIMHESMRFGERSGKLGFWSRELFAHRIAIVI